MAIKNILEKISDFGITKHYFELLTIAELDKSCCTESPVELIDFDKTKSVICKKNGWVDIKSCDGLKILIEKDRIDLIEMKSIKLILSYQQPDSKVKLAGHISKFDFINKIRDSLTILVSITQEGFLNKQERVKYHEIPKQPILLTDIDYINFGLDFLVFGFEYLGNLSTDINELLQKELDSVKSDFLNNIKQPLLMDCAGISEFYKN
jgi:hypothetical protein